MNTGLIIAIIFFFVGVFSGMLLERFDTQYACDKIQILNYGDHLYRCVEFTHVGPTAPLIVRRKSNE